MNNKLTFHHWPSHSFCPWIFIVMKHELGRKPNPIVASGKSVRQFNSGHFYEKVRKTKYVIAKYFLWENEIYHPTRKQCTMEAQ